MATSRDPSVWRSLAVAFGDGVAFGVGMKLTHNAAARAGERRLSAPAASEVSASPSLDRQAMDALVEALEARLKEHSGQMERRVAELDAHIALELKVLRQQDKTLATSAQSAIDGAQERWAEQVAAAARKADEDREALRQQFLGLHREFAVAVSQVVEEQVANQVEASTEKLRQVVEEAVAQRVAGLRDELETKDREIAGLRQRLSENDRNVLDIILGMGELCRQVAGRIGSPDPASPAQADTEPPPAPIEKAAEPEPRSAPAPDSEAPEFAQVKEGGLWRVPLVSSFVLTAGGLFLLHYL